MPWLYVEPGKGFPADVTDDDANVVGTITNYRLDTRQDRPGQWEALATLDIFITDFEGWMQGFHKQFMGG